MSVHWGGRGAGHVSRRPLGVGGFSPATLFATGEQGVWYDPSDLTTLFQDSAGTTPVTAAAQQVGLALDKSQGLALGPELVTLLDGWTPSNATVSVVGGQLVITSSGSGTAYITKNFTNVGGAYYYSTSTVSGGSVVINTYRSGPFTNFMFSVPTNGTNAVQASTDTDATAAITLFWTASAAGETRTLSNISVKLLAGNHAFQSTSAQRPTLGRNPFTGTRNILTFTEQFDNAAWTKSGSSVSVNATTAPDGTLTADKLQVLDTSNSQKNVSQTVGAISTTYTDTVYAKAAELSWLVINQFDGADRRTWFNLSNGTVGTTAAGTTASIQALPNGWYRCTAVRAMGTGSITLVLNVANADNSAVFVGTVGQGIFVWGAQRETGSTATAYQRVVSSFDVTEAGVPDVWYLSFDGTDDGMLTNTITPGIDKAQVFTGVRKLSDAASGLIAETSVSIASNNGAIRFSAPKGASANYAFDTKGTVEAGAFTSNTFAAPITNVVTGIGDIAGDVATIRVNGTVAASTTTDQGTGNYLAYPLYIGRRGGSSLPLNGRIYSLILRFGANLSAVQIAQTETWVGGKTGVTI